MLEEKILRIQNVNDSVFLLLFLYNKYMKINLPITDNDVAVYGRTFRSSLSICVNNLPLE